MIPPFDINECILHSKRIDIWRYPLHTSFPGATELLNDDETHRANRFYFPRHQRRFTLAHAILRLILCRYTSIPPKDLIFQHNDHGKPELIHSPLTFNLSHSGDWALLAVGNEYPLGNRFGIFFRTLL